MFFLKRVRSRVRSSLWLGTTLSLLAADPMTAQDMGGIERDFARPPDSARPWVWGHWLHGNVNKEAITRELEAMKRAGLGGVTMFDVAQPGIPAGPNAYMSAEWQELFSWQIREAKRVGLEVMSHLGPGYSGSGGPWIPHELASQRIYESTTRHRGGSRFSGRLPQPETPGGFYRDVAVLAVREKQRPKRPHLADFDMKRVVWLNYIRWKGVISAPDDARLPAADCLAPSDVIDLTPQSRPGGELTWDAPAGDWTILRLGHGWTGQNTLPAPPEGQGPECDKLDKRGIRAHFDHVMKRMVALAGPEAGKTFHTFFVDSWEAGGQNWTEAMPAEFRRRRGYDIIPYLPILTGRVIGDVRTSERFLHDLRQTVSELMTENFWAEMRRLCHASGMRLAVQPYITTGNDFDAANHTDEPMGEFWKRPFQPNDYRATIKTAVSAANLNGHLIVGAEAFTSDETERWLDHPATLKELGDKAFCLGANRFQFHRFAMQRFPNVKPGLTMGKWGLHYDSTQTWWEWSKPWHDYLARCQHLLRSGPVVTDVLLLTPEEPLWRYEHVPVPGHDFDVCGPDSSKNLHLIHGRPGFRDDRVYSLIEARHCGRMSVERLRRLRDLVRDGAALLGNPPSSTPGLTGLPAADDELDRLSKEIWGTGSETERRLGKGRVFRGISTGQALARLGVQPDFSGPDHLSWIHRRSQEMDLYFVCSSAAEPTSVTCTFRSSAPHVERWDPETGGIQPLAFAREENGRTRVKLDFGPHESTFVVFRKSPSSALVPGPQASRTLTPASELKGPWELRFPGSGLDGPVRFETPISWATHPDPRIRHFSGKATYTCAFEAQASQLPQQLDLGKVEIMAKVTLNGNDLGILWKPPYQVDISRHVRPGRNLLEIEVVNLWVNRMIADESLPADSKRDAKGVLTEWPEWLLQGSRSPVGRQTFTTFPLWTSKDELRPSGLLGPVILR